MIVFYNNLAALYLDLFASNYSCKEGFIESVFVISIQPGL